MTEVTKTPTPSDKDKAYNWSLLVYFPFLMALLYVLSTGPVLMLVEKGRLSATSSLEAFYSPMDRAYRKTRLHTPLGLYFHLWAPNRFDEHGNMK